MSHIVINFVDFMMKNYYRLESFSTAGHSEDVAVNTLCWENISVWKKCPKTRGVFCKTTYEEVQLLNNVNGFARSGSLVALMGSSGSGKTTLLASISRRLTEGFYGDIYMNGEVINRSRMIKISGFVPQTYLTMDYFTVYEHMYFMARMKMDKRTSEIDRIHRISRLLNQFGLDTCYSTFLHQLSGGERKRLSIATEMLTDPQILFCDEPTTGLDSWNASSVISALRKFCSLGKIVICSIHQPASGIFDLFDDVILLATGGRAAYSGPVNKTTEYFARLQYKCPPSYNVAEFLINIISVSPKRHIRQVKVICDMYAASGQAAKVKDQIKSARSTEQKLSKFSSSPTKSLTDSRIESLRHVGILTQSYLLTCRSLTDIRRHYKVGMIPYIVFLFLISMNTSSFPKILHSEEHRQQNIGGYLSIFIYDSSLLLSHMLLNSLIDPQSSREIRSGLYTIQAHYLSCIIGVTCKTMVFTTLLVIVSKNLTDCFEYLSYSQMAIVLYIFISSAIALGCLVSAISDDVVIYPVIMNVYDIASQCVGGVYSSLSGLTTVAKYAKYLFLTYYARQAIMVLEWETIDIEEMKQFNVSLNDPAAFRHLKTLAQQGLSIYDYKYNLYVLSAFAIICHCIAYILVARNSKKEAVY